MNNLCNAKKSYDRTMFTRRGNTHIGGGTLKSYLSIDNMMNKRIEHTTKHVNTCSHVRAHRNTV